MRYAYAKMTFHMMLVSFLALMFMGCGESGSPGGSSGPGVTASIALSLGHESLPADGSSSTAVTVMLTDATGKAVSMGTSVAFSTTIGKFANGQKEFRASTSDESGSVTVSLISETKTGDAVVKATSNKITQSIKLTFIDGGIATPAYLTLGASTNKVKTDNSDNAEITAIVLDKDRAPIKGISVAFSTTAEDGSAGAGQLSASTLVTDENGSAVVKFSSGVGDKRNQIVTITVTVEGLPARQIPMQVTGSYIIISAQGETNIPVGGPSSNLKIVVNDAGNAPAYDVPVTLALSSDSTGTVTITPASGKTDINGEFQVAVTGATAGTAVVEVESLGAVGTQTYIVDDPNKIFRIIEPADEIVSLKTNTNLTVKVTVGDYDKVVFATTIGAWDGGTKKAVEKSAVNGEATAVLTSGDAGTSTIQVYPVADPSISDSMRVAISAPSSEASKINLQAASSVVAPSTDQIKNSVALTAKVTNSKNQVVSGAPVLFSIQNPTGGGEYIVPAIAYSDEAGIATSVFTSGSLVPGADGVRVTAELINVNASDTVSIIISGKAASLVIGRSTMLESINDGTAYKLPMSVLVTDANGSPVKQATVSLNLWPSRYRTGYWELNQSWDINGNLLTFCTPIVEGDRLNEDVNKNLIMDEGEDINQDGLLTPPSSAGGSIPSIVVTDENGVANFDMIYMKSSAVWIEDAITATTVVSGTETLSSFSFVLPWLEQDADDCTLPGSPYEFEDVEPVVNSISISSGISTIPADGGSTAVIRATVFGSDDKPMAGQPVAFTTTLGTFTSPNTVTTDNFGVAAITLKAGTFPGTAIVTAECSGFTDQLEITMTSAGLSTVTLTAIPDSVVPGGTVMLIAAAKDRFGNPVVGEQLNFQISQNTTGATLNGTSIPSDANGQVTLNYTAGSLEGTDQIKVTADSNQSISKALDIRVEQAAAIVGSITLTSNTTTIPADGTSSAQLTATIKNTAGNPVPKDTPVAFSTTLGSFQNGGRSITFQTADASGVIIFSLKSSGTDGTAKVTAVCEGVSQSINITIGEEGQPGVAGSITLTSGAGSLPADGISSTPVTAIAYDTTGTPMPQGTEIIFTTEGGKFPNGTDPDGLGKKTSRVTLVTADASGKIVTSLIASENGGIAKVQADCGGVTQVIYIVMVDPNDSVASIELTAADAAIPADGNSSTVITAIVTDNFGKPVSSGTEVLLKTNLGTFAGGQTSLVLMTSGTTGTVLTSLISGIDVGTATVTAISGSITQSVQVAFTKGTVAEAEYLTLSASKTSIKTNNLDSTNITALVLDMNRAPIKGAVVNFATTGGQISAGSVVTNDNGEAVITVKSGPNKANGTIVITASVGDALTASIPITLYGTEITLTPANAQLTIGLVPAATQSIIVKAKDADGNPIYNAAITISINAGGTGSTVSPSGSQTTNSAGEITLILTAGTVAGTATVTATGLNTSVIGTYTLGAAADIFEITVPATSPFLAPADGSNVPVTVHAGGLAAGANVVFVTSFGAWAGYGTQKTVTVGVDGSLDATLNLTSLAAGVATVQVYAASDSTLMDFVQISFFNPADKACDIIIDASQTNILPSTATSQYSLTIEARVVDINGAPVGEAIVDFSLSNTTGGGEFISPVTAITDATGSARTTFTSGTLSTGSDPGSAVQVTARVATPTCLPDPHEDTVAIVITGGVANVAIGFSSEISPNDDNTLYLLPVSVLVADTNGNAVSGAVVSLGLKPSMFATGYWVDDLLLGWITVCENSCTGSGPCVFVNEDLNNNSVLDNNEDGLNRYSVNTPDLPDYFTGYVSGDQVPGLNNGMLTPGQSVAGTIPTSVTTDENGVASFTLTYQKEYAIWVEDQVTATAMVFGTEYITKSRKWLPGSAKEIDDGTLPNAFPTSPFNTLPCGTVP